MVDWFRERMDKAPDEWTLFLVNGASDDLAYRLPGVQYAKFAPDGKALAVVTTRGDLRLYDFPFPGGWRSAVLPAAGIGVLIHIGLAALGRRRTRHHAGVLCSDRSKADASINPL
jgi:hypothetical protein